jgi:hypothetical protein
VHERSGHHLDAVADDLATAPGRNQPRCHGLMLAGERKRVTNPRVDAHLLIASSEARHDLGSRVVIADGAEDLQIRECRGRAIRPDANNRVPRKSRMQVSPRYSTRTP